MKTSITINIANILTSMRSRLKLASPRCKVVCLMVFTVTIACIVGFFYSAAVGNGSEPASALATSHGDTHLFSLSTRADNGDAAKIVKAPSRIPSSGLGAMNAVELHVRESTFFQQIKGKERVLAASYDLYFLYQDDRSKSRAEVVFRRLALQSFDAETNRIEILVPEQDVPIILSLEMMGEYQLVRRSLRDRTSVEGENAHMDGQSIPLGDRDWVKQLVGDGSVVVVP